MRLIAIARSIGAGAVCDKYQIILDEVDGLLFAVLHIQNLLGDFFVAFGFDQDVFHIHAEFDVHAVRFQIFYERQNHTLVLIILCKAQRTEVGQTVDVMHIAAQIPLHFQCTGPALESKHGLPVQPEIRVPEGVRQHIGNFPVLQILFRCQKQLGKRQRGLLIQLEFSVRVCVLAAVYRRTAEGVIGIVLVEPVIFIQDRNVRCLDGRNIAEGVPHDLEMIVHFASAAHEEAFGDILAAVAAAAGKRQLFKQMDVFAFHLSVANEIERSGQTGKTGADDVSGFLIYIFWFFGMSERFIRSCRVIHNNNLPFFSLCFQYTRSAAVYNRQKKLRDTKLITEQRSVKNFIRWAEVIKITAGILQEPPISSRLSAWQADLQCSADPPAYPL